MANVVENAIIKFFKPFFREDNPGDLYHYGAKPPTTRRLEELLKTYQFSDLLPYDSFDEDDALFFNFDSYGFAVELSTAVGMTEETIEVLSGIFSGENIEKDTVIQHCLYASPDVMPQFSAWANSFVFDDEDAESLSGRNANIFRTIARKRIDHLIKGNWQSISEDTSLMSRNFRAFIIFQKPYPEGQSS